MSSAAASLKSILKPSRLGGGGAGGGSGQPAEATTTAPPIKGKGPALEEGGASPPAGSDQPTTVHYEKFHDRVNDVFAGLDAVMGGAGGNVWMPANTSVVRAGRTIKDIDEDESEDESDGGGDGEGEDDDEASDEEEEDDDECAG
jgi:hypothetical protein